MRMVFGLVLLVGIALAGGAVYLAKDQIAQYQRANAQAQAQLAKVVPTLPVYVAVDALEYGQPLTKENVRIVHWPEDAIPEGAFTEETALFPENTDKPRIVLRQMEKSEAILAVKITEPGQDAGLTSRLEKGMRAFAIRVDVSSGVSGFLRPGDHVDVYWTGRVSQPGQRASDDVTKLIESTVKIIAIDQNANARQGDAAIARTVTVAVNPVQVAALAQAQATGKLALSLVGVGDDTVSDAIEVDQRSLLGLEAETVAVTVEKEKVCTIRTRRGAEVVEIPIPCTN